jgi:hypothetical protein
MAEVKFIDNTVKVKVAMREKGLAVMEEVTGELESQTKRNTRVAPIMGGHTKNSWKHTVKEDGDTIVGTVGNTEENAIWEEFGTGEYALEGNGRKGGWWYKSGKDGKWYHTFGKKPSRALFKAYSSLKNKIINHIQNAFRELK